MENEILQQYRNMLAAAVHFFCIMPLAVVGPMTILIIFFTRYWYISVLYLIWIWIIDKNTAERGGRINNWLRGLKIYEYVRDYYPVSLIIKPGFKLDPKRNYIFGSFPHGIIPIGMSIALTTKACSIDTLISSHTIHPVTLDFVTRLPLIREYYQSFGVCSAKAESINWLLSYPRGGKIVAIVVGGVAEASVSTPGIYKIVLKNRKGFVKLALKNGSPLVPLFSFGEVDIFKQCNNSEGTWLHHFQEWCKKKLGLPPLCFYGRGYFQRYVGLIPLKKPINVVVGNVIEVEKNSSPSQEEIDDLHQIFMTKLNELFEEYKYKFVENAEETTLIFV